MFIHLSERRVTRTRQQLARVTQARTEARKEEILHAASRLFIHRGMGEATMQEIAEEAGLSAGAIYRYYPSKDDLMQAFFEHCVAEGPVALIDRAGSGGTALQRLRMAARMVRDFWIEDPDKIIGDMQTSVASVRQPEQVGTLVCRARGRMYDAIQEIIEEAQQQGEIDPAYDARALGMALHAFVYGIGMMALNAHGEEMERNFDTMFGVFDDILGRLGPASDGASDRLDAE